MPETLNDPAVMTPQQRHQEIASILAKGVLRLRQTAQSLPGPRSSRTSENTAKLRKDCLMRGPKRALMCSLDSHGQNMKGARKT